jgi:hypothetical protein
MMNYFLSGEALSVMKIFLTARKHGIFIIFHMKKSNSIMIFHRSNACFLFSGCIFIFLYFTYILILTLFTISLII